MKCEYCDRELEKGVLVCPYCGGEVTEQVSKTNDESSNLVNNIPSDKKSKIPLFIALGIVLIVVISVAIFFIVRLSAKTRIGDVDTTYQFDYENVAYYISDEEVVIDNAASVTTTTSAKTTEKATTKLVTTTKVQINTTKKTTKRTTTTRPVVTNNSTPSSTTITTRSSGVPTVSTTTSTITTDAPTTSITPPASSSTTTTSLIPPTSNTTTTSSSTTTSTTTTSSTTTSTTVSKPTDKPISRSLLIYMVGSDLESEDASATNDIIEMATAHTDDYTNIYLYAGGASKWHLENINPTSNGLYIVKNGYIIPIADFGNKNMGEADTLAEFINFVDTHTDTDRYDLILWDHGSGPIGGYGNDEKANDLLYLAEIVSALDKTNFKGNRKFEFIGFDACLMASVEVGHYLSDYADYLLASEESEIGWGWDYTALDNISNLETVDLAKKIIDAFAEANRVYMQYFPNTAYTLSLVDLSKIDSVVKSINQTFKNVTSTLNSDYENYAYLRLNALEFGTIQQGASYDLVDIYSFAEAANFNDLKRSVENVVVYSNSNLKNAHGLTVYFPYTCAENIVDYWLENIYSSFTDFKDYYNFLTAFVDIRYSDKKRVNLDISKSQGKFKAVSNQLSIQVSDEDKKNIAKSNYIVFEKEEDGNYMPVYRGNDLTLQGNNLVANYNKKILNIVENNDVGTTPIYESKVTNRGTLYLGIAVLVDFEDDFKVDSGYAKFFIKGDEVTFQGITPFESNDNEEELDAKNKMEWQLEDWQSVQFANFRYNILDKNGRYTRDWQSLDSKYLFEVSPKKNKVEFKMNDLFSDKEYYAVINVLDFQGNVSSSDLIPIK